jgi:hypothetical protein
MLLAKPFSKLKSSIKKLKLYLKKKKQQKQQEALHKQMVKPKNV